MAKSGDIQWSGRALRYTLWRAPKRAAEYTAAGFLATGQEIGRRWLSIAGLGLWLWLLWRVAAWTGIQGAQELTSFLLLLWIWRVIVLLRWTIRLRVEAARVRAFQRQQFQMIQQLPGQMRQLAASVPRPDGGIDVLGLFRGEPDPVTAEQQQTRRRQAEEIRSQLPEESRDIPLGDRPEPVIPMPRWLRRRGPK
jgi:hypothetical protein